VETVCVRRCIQGCGISDAQNDDTVHTCDLLGSFMVMQLLNQLRDIVVASANNLFHMRNHGVTQIAAFFLARLIRSFPLVKRCQITLCTLQASS
jgi:hypothetical protein